MLPKPINALHTLWNLNKKKLKILWLGNLNILDAGIETLYLCADYWKNFETMKWSFFIDSGVWMQVNGLKMSWLWRNQWGVCSEFSSKLL